MVKDIHTTWPVARYRTIDLSEVRYLGIDEFSLRKRHTYMTVFVDLQIGRILHTVEGTSKEAISPFLRTMAKKAKKIIAVQSSIFATSRLTSPNVGGPSRSWSRPWNGKKQARIAALNQMQDANIARANAEQALSDLLESRERLSLFIEHAPAALAMFIREMRHLAASRRWRDDYFLGEPEILGHSHYDVFPEINEVWKTVRCRW